MTRYSYSSTSSASGHPADHIFYSRNMSFAQEVLPMTGGYGLGRAIVKWMTDRGARYLTLPSRSGPSASPTALQVINELRAQGVTVVAPQCEASLAESLSSLFQTCTNDLRMSPVRGCPNAAVVQQDAVFSNMTHAQKDLAVRTKVQTSWNLHQLLVSPSSSS